MDPPLSTPVPFLIVQTPGLVFHCGDATMLRDNLTGLIEPMFSSAGAYPLALCTDWNKSSDDRPQHALKIPARQGEIYALTENVTSPFRAEPRHPKEADY